MPVPGPGTVPAGAGGQERSQLLGLQVLRSHAAAPATAAEDVGGGEVGGGPVAGMINGGGAGGEAAYMGVSAGGGDGEGLASTGLHTPGQSCLR